MGIPPLSPFTHPIPRPVLVRPVGDVPPLARDPAFTVPPISTGPDGQATIKPEPEPSSTPAPVIVAGLAAAGFTLTAAAIVAAIVISRRR